MAEIKYIPVSKLWRHPDNPRKDLGDVTELAESIKVNGVLQNLTVVPLIGEKSDAHRFLVQARSGTEKATALSSSTSVLRPQSWLVWRSFPASWSRCRSGSS